MSPFVFFFVCILFGIGVCQLCKDETNDGKIASSNSFELNAQDEEHAYLLNIIQYESGTIDLSLSHKWTNMIYETRINSDKYNEYHASETLHPIISAKQFIHFIDISMSEQFEQTNYEISNTKLSNHQITLRLFCEKCVTTYDIQIPFFSKSMQLDDAILLLQHLSSDFKQYKKYSNKKINTIENELKESNIKIMALQNELNTKVNYSLNLMKILSGSLDSSTSSSFDSEVNILTKSNSNIFTFTGYPNTDNQGVPKYIADQIDRRTASQWPNYGYDTKPDGNGIAYIEIDLKKKYFITKYAVSGYPGGQHKPTSVYYLRASNDRKTWNVVGMSGKDTWTSDAYGTYPFRCVQQVINPDFYRYYQFYGIGFDNNWLLIMNAGLWTPKQMLSD